MPGEFIAAMPLAGALTADLAGAGQHGWVWCRASCIRLGDHSWVECDDWAFDASNGCRRPVIVMRSAAYIAMRGAVNPQVLASISARAAANCR
jgi:hypothetical protein